MFTVPLLALALPFLPMQDADSAAKDAVSAFKEAFLKPAAALEAQKAAVKKLGEVRHEETRKVLLALLTSHTDPVRIEAARALAGFIELKGTAEKVSAALVHKANAQKSAVRIEIVKCLASLKDPAALPNLHKVVRDRDLFVAKEVIVSLPLYRHKASVQVLIDYLKLCETAPQPIQLEIPVDMSDQLEELQEYELPQWNFSVVINAGDYEVLRKNTLHQPILEALNKLTGEKLVRWHSWNEWWKIKAASFKVPEK